MFNELPGWTQPPLFRVLIVAEIAATGPGCPRKRKSGKKSVARNKKFFI